MLAGDFDLATLLGDLSITGLQFFEQPHILDSYHGLEQKFTEITVFVDSLARKARLN